MSDESSGVPRTGKNRTQDLKADPLQAFAARLNSLLKKAWVRAKFPKKHSSGAKQAAEKVYRESLFLCCGVV
jgi:hypothetical protein